MKKRDDLNSPGGDEFFQLANDWLENDLSGEDRDKLRDLLKSDEHFRRAFQEIIHLDTASRALLADHEGLGIGLRGLEEKMDPEVNVVQWKRRGWIGAAAASIAAVGGIALWKQSRIGATGGESMALLDPRWSMQAASGAVYEILSPGHVKLISGELTFDSSEAAELLVETPFAKAVARGSKFLIGHHGPVKSQNKNTEENEKMKRHTFTRMLVLAGAVTLTNSRGKAEAVKNEAVIAEADKAPVKLAVEANSTFAFECYARLAEENAGKNIFFSPYSISNALLMAAEGARGETAVEMGDVLGLPSGLRRVGEAGQQIPWEMGVIHTGHARLGGLFNASTPEQVELRKKEIELSRKLDLVKSKTRKAEEEARGSGKRFISPFLREEFELVRDLNAIRKKIDGVTLKVANALWGEQSKSFKEAWQKTVKESYGAGAIQQADFIRNSEIERQRINAWVSEQTEGRIAGLIPEGGVHELTRLVITNAIYFKGEWAAPFNLDDTSPKEFNLANGAQVEVPLMKKVHNKGARYAAFNGDGTLFETPLKVPRQGEQPQTYPGEDGFALVELPYQGGETSMVIIAPNDAANLAGLEASLSSGNLTKWLSALQKRKTRIEIPKFQFKAAYNLNDTLAAMGMPKAFDEGKADFSGIAEKDGAGLFIGEVIHQAFIEVNEAGTEAAAATSLGIDSRSLPQKMVTFIPTFRADRPFIYLIRDQKSGAILFLGRVCNPNAI